MKVKYWDEHAQLFDKEIFNPLDNDINGIFEERLNQLASKYLTAADFGCGTGRQLPLLQPLFKSIIAMDQSKECIQIARRENGKFSNISIFQHDLAKPLKEHQLVDVGVCINVAIMPDYQLRTSLMNNICNMINSDGKLLLVVPSIESILLSVYRLLRWNLKQSQDYREAAVATTGEMGFTKQSIRDGVADRGGVPTKHYLKEELEILLSQSGFKIVTIDKVEYKWNTEFVNPPRSMQAPYPWDWLIVAHKK